MPRTMTKSTLRFARTAFHVAQQALPPYGKPRSQKRYTQPQLFALLAVRSYLKLDYRGLVILVSEWAELRKALQLQQVPHYSTLCYAEQRLLKKGGPKHS